MRLATPVPMTAGSTDSRWSRVAAAPRQKWVPLPKDR